MRKVKGRVIVVCSSFVVVVVVSCELCCVLRMGLRGTVPVQLYLVRYGSVVSLDEDRWTDPSTAKRVSVPIYLQRSLPPLL
jgi:hypothetical protein